LSAEHTIRMLQAGYRTRDREEWTRKQARVAWIKEIMAALRAAQERVDAARDRMLGALADDIDDEELEELNLPDPPEQAELDAIHAQIDAVLEQDKWPRHLYFGGI
jgi:hypothetical protein